jgi:hypothetical protein
MAFQALAHQSVAAEMVHVVVRLEQAVLLYDPGHFRPHVGPENAGRNFGVVVRSEFIADVVYQCPEHELLVGARGFGASRHLQGMPEASDGVAVEGAVELAERCQQPVRQSKRETCARTDRAAGSPRACRLPSCGS